MVNSSHSRMLMALIKALFVDRNARTFPRSDQLANSVLSVELSPQTGRYGGGLSRQLATCVDVKWSKLTHSDRRWPRYQNKKIAACGMIGDCGYNLWPLLLLKCSQHSPLMMIMRGALRKGGNYNLVVMSVTAAAVSRTDKTPSCANFPPNFVFLLGQLVNR